MDEALIPDSHPDYEKPLKRMAITYCTGAVALLIVFAAGSISGAPGWMIAGATLLIILGALVATACIDVSWIREQRRQREQQRLASGLTPPGARPLRQRLAHPGFPGALLSSPAAFGLPLAIAGALGQVREVLIIGIVLIGLGLIDQAILWPIRHARAARATQASGR